MEVTLIVEADAQAPFDFRHQAYPAGTFDDAVAQAHEALAEFARHLEDTAKSANPRNFNKTSDTVSKPKPWTH